jgi:hypothetical protein
MAHQSGWNFCSKCGAMTLTSSPGPCVAGGNHQAQGFNFVLQNNIPEAPFTQQDWRQCVKCSGLYFGPGEPKPCVKGGDHEPGSLNFVLAHDIPETSNTQRKWFCCGHCSLMTFGPTIGRCVADKQGTTIGHDGSASFEFVLPHTAQFTP